MKNIKPRMDTMRLDFTFSTEAVYLPSTSTIGFRLDQASPGCWITWQEGDDQGCLSHGRVIGKVTTDDDGEVFLMVAAMNYDLTFLMMRWVKPRDVRSCHAAPPRRMLTFLMGDWEDPQAICDAIARGMIEDYEWAGVAQ